MIIYGHRSTKIASEDIYEKCTNCGTSNSVTLSIYQKHGHVFWIPFVPMKKLGFSECSQCKLIVEKDDFGPTYSAPYETLRSQTKTPWWNWSGLVILLGIIGFATLTGMQNSDENAEFVAKPKSGDIYEVNFEAGEYSLLKVTSVNGDTVWVRANMYVTNKISGLSDLKAKGDSVYYTEESGFLIKDLKGMLEKGEIVDVERN